MKIFVKTVGVALVTLFGIALVSCSDTPSNDVIKNAILKSSPYISKLEILKVSEYDEKINRCIVRAKYQWSPQPLFREEGISDFKFYKDIGNGEWKLLLSTTNISRKRI